MLGKTPADVGLDQPTWENTDSLKVDEAKTTYRNG